MEIRANYILVGIFSLLTIVGILLTVTWLNKDAKPLAQDMYDVNFRESVRGLSVSSPVFFSGIRVGQVSSITLSTTEPGAVRVRITLNADTPVRENSEARLEMLGLTGNSAITISGGSATSPLMTHSNEVIRILKAQRSPLDAVMKDMPTTLTMVNDILTNMNNVLSKENQEQLSIILESTAQLTSSLAGQTDTIENILQRTQSTITEVDNIMKSIGQLSTRLDRLVTKAAPGVERLASESATQVQSLLVETRELIHSLKRISQNFNNDPKLYLFGTPVRQHQP